MMHTSMFSLVSKCGLRRKGYLIVLLSMLILSLSCGLRPPVVWSTGTSDMQIIGNQFYSSPIAPDALILNVLMSSYSTLCLITNAATLQKNHLDSYRNSSTFLLMKVTWFLIALLVLVLLG